MNNFSNYLNTIARANGLGNLPLEWLFYPGMLQDSKAMWWADFGTRHAAHEGIDICFFREAKSCNPISVIEPGTRVPAFSDGTILNISKDLMGKSLAVAMAPAPQIIAGYSGSLPSPVLVYSHLEPEPGITVGSRIKKNEIFARTFDARTIKSRLRSHIHMSCILIAGTLDKMSLDWSLFADRKKVAYINPVFL